MPADAPPPIVQLSGSERVRVVGLSNLDLDPTTIRDAAVAFADHRAQLSLAAAWPGARLIAGVDLAGSDFDEGARLGFEPGDRQRPLQLGVRQLALELAGPFGLTATLGRQPMRLGSGIVASLHRDAFKLAAPLPAWGPATAPQAGLALVRAAKGRTTPGPVVGLANPLDGSPYELNAVAATLASPLGPAGRLQAYALQALDARGDAAAPVKRYVGLAGEAMAGAATLGGEVAHLASTARLAAPPATPVGGLAAYAFARAALGPFTCSLAAGRGDPGFSALFTDETAFAYDALFADDLHGYDGTDASLARGGGFANVTFLQPGLAFRWGERLTVALAYTRHLATEPRPAGGGPLGPPTGGAPVQAIGDEVDLRADWRAGPLTLYGLAATFVPGAIYARPGLGARASRLELGSEVRF